jgi:hypothetical protein
MKDVINVEFVCALGTVRPEELLDYVVAMMAPTAQNVRITVRGRPMSGRGCGRAPGNKSMCIYGERGCRYLGGRRQL